MGNRYLARAQSRVETYFRGESANSALRHAQCNNRQTMVIRFQELGYIEGLQLIYTTRRFVKVFFYYMNIEKLKGIESILIISKSKI